jgi:hypothetical protein
LFLPAGSVPIVCKPATLSESIKRVHNPKFHPPLHIQKLLLELIDVKHWQKHLR